MNTSQCLPLDEIFTHIEELGEGKTHLRHINASALLRATKEKLQEGTAQVLNVEIDPEFIDFVRTRRGVEPGKLARLCEPYMSLPCLGFWMPDGACLMVDGHHRVVKKHEAGETSYKMVIFDHSCLEEFCIYDLDKTLSAVMADATVRQETAMDAIRRIFTPT